MVGSPVGMVERSSPIKGLGDYSKIEIISRVPLSTSSNPTYHLMLKKTLENDIVWTGFTESQQIGQYFSLTISNARGWNRITRLYTTVWCMRPQNITLLKNHLPQLEQQLLSR